MIDDYNLFKKCKFLCKLGMQPRYNFFEKKKNNNNKNSEWIN